MAIHKQVKQPSVEWFQLRAGRPTASQIEKIVTPAKLGYSQSAESYKNHLIGERYSGYVEEFSSSAMEEGKRREPESRAAFTLTTKLKTEEGGIYLTNDFRIAASPDARIIGGGLCEFKNPGLATHISYDRSDGKLLYADYKLQTQTQLYVSEQDFVWLFSYHPNQADVMVKVERDPEVIGKLEEHLKRFCDELDEAWESHKKKHGITSCEWDALLHSLSS
jgi:hypothetical protein